MAEMIEVIIRPEIKREREKVRQKLSWYDWSNDIQYEDEGGQMLFFYDYQLKRMIPHVADAFVPKESSNYDQIKQRLEELEVEHAILSDSRREIIVGIDKKDFIEIFPVMEEALDGFRYEVIFS